MIFQAYMCAFAKGKPRTITVPDEAIEENASNDILLGLCFYHGQNEFACPEDLAQRLPSMSVGDVVKLPDGSWHVCQSFGWKQLPEGTTMDSLVTGPEAALGAFFDKGSSKDD